MRVLELHFAISQSACISVCHHRRSQDFVWGCTFSYQKKADDLFLVVALKERLNTPPNLTRPAKTVLKIDSCSGWGVHFVAWGCTYTFPCKLRLQNIFHRPGGCRCTHCTPWLRLCVSQTLWFVTYSPRPT